MKTKELIITEDGANYYQHSYTVNGEIFEVSRSIADKEKTEMISRGVQVKVKVK